MLAILSVRATKQSLRFAAAFATAVPPATLLAFAGIAKLKDPFPAVDFLTSAFAISIPVGFRLVRALAAVELVVASLVILGIGRSRWPARAGAALFAAFISLILLVLQKHPDAASCGCYGGLYGDFLARRLYFQIWLNLTMALSLMLHTLVVETPARRPSEPRAGR